MGLLLSGGLDSTILLGHLLQEGWQVQPFYVRCGLVWEPEEFVATRRVLARHASEMLEDLVVLEVPLADLYGDHWSMTGHEVPASGTPDRAVYLPDRNLLLLTKAALWCHQNQINHLALGTLASNPFEDASSEFFETFQAAITIATGGQVTVVRPLQQMSKCEAMLLGSHHPLELTFSCISPSRGLHCGVCNKCSERQEAFRVLGDCDPTLYHHTPVIAGQL